MAYITFLMIDELFWIARSVFEIIFIVVLGVSTLRSSPRINANRIIFSWFLCTSLPSEPF